MISLSSDLIFHSKLSRARGSFSKWRDQIPKKYFQDEIERHGRGIFYGKDP